MNGRQKMEAAFSERGTSEVPAVLSCYEDIYQRDHWDNLTQCRWWHREAPGVETQMLWRREALENTPEDWFRLPFCPPAEARRNQHVEETPDGVFLVDRKTGARKELHRPPVGDWPEHGYAAPAHPPESPEAIDRAVPIPHEDDVTYVRAEGRDAVARALLAEFGRERLPTHRTSTPLLRCADLWGFDGMMLNIRSRPDLVARACGRYLEQSKATMRRAALLGAKAIWVVDGLGDMISPADYFRLGVPFLRELLAEIRRLGRVGVWYFTGSPAGKWDIILSAGADALAFEDAKKGWDVDVVEVARKLEGRSVLFGNLNAIEVLQNGTDEELKAEIKRQLAAAPINGGRFVMSIGSPITPGTPVERVKLYCKLVHELGVIR
jgi:hypothetical protein